MAEVGITLPGNLPGVPPELITTIARRAEELGVHSLWVTDRLVYNTLEPLTVLTAAAAVTSRIRLGSGVLLAPLRSPVYLAKVIATLDALSGGRLTLGLGIGNRPDDFAAVEAPFGRRGRRFEEQVEIMRMVWSGQPVKYQGEFYQVDVGPVGPKPAQPGGPPLWIGGVAPAVLRRAARLASGYFTGSAAGPQGFARLWGQVQEHAREAGRDPASLSTGSLAYFHIAPDMEQGKEAVVNYVTRYYGRVNLDLDTAAVVGPPKACVERIRSFFDAGVQVLVLLSVTADVTQVERLAEDVLPHLPR